MSSGGASGSNGTGLDEDTWSTLVDAVLNDECTPFLGAGVAVPHLPRGSDLAGDLAKEFGYPLDDAGNLPRVAQYIASKHQPAFAKRRVAERIVAAQEQAAQGLRHGLPPNYRILAELRLPLYVTTNYDDYLERAILGAGTGGVDRVICRWNSWLCAELPPYSKAKPSGAKPMVFHLHGHVDLQNSILVTEDDYIDFTVSLAQRGEKPDPVLPHFVRRALGNTNLLFIGYSLEDWNFRVLLRHLLTQQNVTLHHQKEGISIQLASTSMPPERRRKAEEFLESYLKTSAKISVYWGDAHDFLTELHRRVSEARTGRKAS